jgi:transposase
MRKGFDGLSGLVRNEFNMDPLLGDVFVFLSRSSNRIKILHWQGDGFCIYSKRLEKGTFELPEKKSVEKAVVISAQQLQLIIAGITLSSVKKRVRYEHHFVEKNAVLPSASVVI